jgi:CRP-like cAMP-binding protein
MKHAQGPVRNRLLDAPPDGDRMLLAENLEPIALERGDVLFEPGEDIVNIHFPGAGTVTSLLLNLRDGLSAEAAMIGQEGAAGGIVSAGDKPAFARGVVQIAGDAWRLPTKVLEKAKQRSPRLRDHFARYADCLLAQVMQSVACNAEHDVDARLARWLLTTQDRAGSRELHVTHNFISEVLGVRRSYVTRVVGALERGGSIERCRGAVIVRDRRKLERMACECYAYLRRHYERLMPGVYPAFGE